MMSMSKLANSKIGTAGRVLIGIETVFIPSYEMLNPSAVYSQETEKFTFQEESELAENLAVISTYLRRSADLEGYLPIYDNPFKHKEVSRRTNFKKKRITLTDLPSDSQVVNIESYLGEDVSRLEIRIEDSSPYISFVNNGKRILDITEGDCSFSPTYDRTKKNSWKNKDKANKAYAKLVQKIVNHILSRK